MSFRHYLILMSIATVAAWISWIVVLMSIDPTKTGGHGLVYFYLTLTFALIGSISLAGTGVRIWHKREELVSRHVANGFRQGVLLSLLIIGSLMLMGSGLFRWWSISLFIAFLGFVEMAFLTTGRRSY